MIAVAAAAAPVAPVIGACIASFLTGALLVDTYHRPRLRRASHRKRFRLGSWTRRVKRVYARSVGASSPTPTGDTRHHTRNV